MENSLRDHILAFLFSAGSTRIYYQILREQEFARYKKNRLYGTLSRLKRGKMLVRSKTGWKLSQSGITYWQHERLFGFLDSPFSTGANRTTLIAFDIPETYRRERVWLREQLKVYGFKMLQRSLWRGPGPLPNEFTLRTKALGITSGIKIFSIIKK